MLRKENHTLHGIIETLQTKIQQLKECLTDYAVYPPNSRIDFKLYGNSNQKQAEKNIVLYQV